MKPREYWIVPREGYAMQSAYDSEEEAKTSAFYAGTAIHVVEYSADQERSCSIGEAERKDLLRIISQYLIIDRFYTEKAEQDAEELLDLILSKMKKVKVIELEKKLELAVKAIQETQGQLRRSYSSADAAVLVTKTLPKDAPPISIIDGVFVVSLPLAVPFISTIRKSIEELSFARATTQGQDEKMKLIYGYLTGPAFKQKITSIVNAFETMKEQHEGEKKYFKKMWAAREKMLEQVIDSAAGMYGDIEGIAGRILPKVDALALPEVKVLEPVLLDGRGDQ